MYDENFLAEMKKQLLAEQDRVESKLNELNAPEVGEENPDWDDTANDAIEDVEQDSLRRIYRSLKERVERSLKNIEDGTYGQCHECGGEIPKDVLENEAWAEHCSTDCIKKHNQGQ